MKVPVAVLLVLSFTSSAQAQDKPNWFHRHKRILIVAAVNGAALGVNAAGLAHCRTGDVENCTGHYGAAWGTFGAWAGVTATFVGLSEIAHKNGDKTISGFLAWTPAAYNFAWGANEWHQYGPEKDSAASLKLHPLYLKLRHP